MLSFRHQLKVGRAVVGRVFVHVVNDFVRGKKPPDLTFHDKAMLHHVALGVREWVLRQTPRPVSSAASVTYKSALPRASGLGRYPAIKAAILPGPTTDAADIQATLATVVRRLLPPTLRQIALARAVAGTFLAAILGMEFRVARSASQGHAVIFHVRNIALQIEERYCEIAAERLSQGVLDLGGAA